MEHVPPEKISSWTTDPRMGQGLMIMLLGSLGHGTGLASPTFGQRPREGPAV